MEHVDWRALAQHMLLLECAWNARIQELLLARRLYRQHGEIIWSPFETCAFSRCLLTWYDASSATGYVLAMNGTCGTTCQGATYPVAGVCKNCIDVNAASCSATASIVWCVIFRFRCLDPSLCYHLSFWIRMMTHFNSFFHLVTHLTTSRWTELALLLAPELVMLWMVSAWNVSIRTQ